MIYRIHKSIVNWLISPKFLIGIFIGCVGYLIYLNDWINLYKSFDLPCNIFEPYIYSVTDKWAVNVSIAGLLFAISDIPYINAKETYCIYRTSRYLWILEKIILVSISVLIYCFGIALIMFILTIPFSYFENQWSNLMLTLANKPIGKMFFNNSYITSTFSPATCFLICWLLNFMYLLMLSFIAFGASLFKGKAVAFSITLIFQAIQYYLTISIGNANFFTCFKNTLLLYCTSNISGTILNVFLFDGATILLILILIMLNKNKSEFWIKEQL